MDGGTAAVLAGLVALVPVAAGALVLILNARHKNQQERDGTALGQYREVADRLQRHVEQRDAHIVELSEAFEDLSAEHGDCQVEVAELYGYLALQHDFGVRAARSLRRLGEDAGEAPPLPARRPRPDRSAAEFRRRQLQQSTQLIQSQSGARLPQVVTPPPPAPPTPPPPTTTTNPPAGGQTP